MHWTNKYIGIPFKEMNCGEFALHIQKEVFQKDYPKLEIVTNPNAFVYNAMIKRNMIEYIQGKIEQPVEGCCVLMRAQKRLSHVGVYTNINSKDYVIHSVDSFKSSVLHQVKDLGMYAYEIEGYYAWK